MVTCIAYNLNKSGDIPTVITLLHLLAKGGYNHSLKSVSGQGL